jgi:hypothetical protein
MFNICVHIIPIFRENRGKEKMGHIKKVYVAAITAFVTLSLVLLSMTAAAGAITLTPTAQAPSASVSVNCTGFGATKAVGIGFGAEVTVTGEAHPITNTTIGGPDVYGPFTTRTNHYPIKPGSFSFHCVVSSDTSVVESDYTDNGDGTLSTTSTYALNPFVKYVTGEFGRSSTTDWSSYTVVFTASYTYYQYNVTPAAGVTTSPSGTFTTSITVPTVANGDYNVTAIDSQGNCAWATLSVSSAIPEGLTVGVMVLLSTVAVIVSTRYFRKRPRIETCGQAKL